MAVYAPVLAVETVREKGKHTIIDGVDEAKAFFNAKAANRLIFISHQVCAPAGSANPRARVGAMHGYAWCAEVLTDYAQTYFLMPACSRRLAVDGVWVSRPRWSTISCDDRGNQARRGCQRLELGQHVDLGRLLVRAALRASSHNQPAMRRTAVRCLLMRLSRTCPNRRTGRFRKSTSRRSLPQSRAWPSTRLSPMHS